MVDNFEVLTNPYYMYESEPMYLCRWIEDGVKWLAAWDSEKLERDGKVYLSVVKEAEEKGYKHWYKDNG